MFYFIFFFLQVKITITLNQTKLVGTCDVRTQSTRAVPSPFPFRVTERKERDDQARVPRPVSATAPGNTRALFRSTRGKELGLWPGTRVFVGRPGFVTAPV
jgi:hypothetical protein